MQGQNRGRAVELTAGKLWAEAAAVEAAEGPKAWAEVWRS